MTEFAIVVGTFSSFKCFADFCLKLPSKEWFSRYKILPKRELYFQCVSVFYSVLVFHSFAFSLVVPHLFPRSLFPSIVPLFRVHFVPFYLNPNYFSHRAIKKRSSFLTQNELYINEIFFNFDRIFIKNFVKIKIFDFTHSVRQSKSDSKMG